MLFSLSSLSKGSHFANGTPFRANPSPKSAPTTIECVQIACNGESVLMGLLGITFGIGY